MTAHDDFADSRTSATQPPGNASLPYYRGAMTVTGKRPAANPETFKIFEPVPILCRGLASRLPDFSEALVVSLHGRFGSDVYMFRTLPPDSASKQTRTGLCLVTGKKKQYWARCEILISARGPDLFIELRRITEALSYMINGIISCVVFVIALTYLYASKSLPLSGSVPLSLLLAFFSHCFFHQPFKVTINDRLAAEPASLALQLGIQASISEVKTRFRTSDADEDDEDDEDD